MGLSALSDNSFASQFSEDLPGDGSVDLELVADDSNSKGLELGGFLGDFLVCLLIEEDGVVQLFLQFNLGPTLLLCFSSLATGCGRLLRILLALGTFGGLGIDFLCLYARVTPRYEVTITTSLLI